MGFEQQLQPVWLARDSERIWRGSYKNKAWKHLVRLASRRFKHVSSTSVLHCSFFCITCCITCCISDFSKSMVCFLLACHRQWIIQLLCTSVARGLWSGCVFYCAMKTAMPMLHTSPEPTAGMCMVGCCMGAPVGAVASSRVSTYCHCKLQLHLH